MVWFYEAVLVENFNGAKWFIHIAEFDWFLPLKFPFYQVLFALTFEHTKRLSKFLRIKFVICPFLVTRIYLSTVLQIFRIFIIHAYTTMYIGISANNLTKILLQMK